MPLLRWLARHDRDFVALRRAGRAAIVMPAMFALGAKVIGNPEVATFAAFGSFAMLLLVGFTGPMRARLEAQAALAVTGAVFVALGTLAGQNVWLATVAMAVIGFGVLFAGVVSSVLAGAATSLLLAFILPVSLGGPLSTIPDRLIGWGLASLASFLAVWLLWPAPTRDALRAAASAAARALAARLRAEVGYLLSDGDLLDARDDVFTADHDRALERSDAAVAALHRVFLATPYRPTGLSTTDRTIVRLVDELSWLNAIIRQTSERAPGTPVNRRALEVKLAAAAVLERGAELLDSGSDTESTNAGGLHAALTSLGDALAALEQDATSELPVRRAGAPDPHDPDRDDPDRNDPDRDDPDRDDTVAEFLSSLDPSFRAQELSFAVSLIAGNIDLATAAQRRGWLERVLGRQPTSRSGDRPGNVPGSLSGSLPGPLPGTLVAAQERGRAHVERHSVWLHNSVRGAAGLGLAVFVANQSGVQHSFWVVLGTLSVLRSNALSTGQNVLRGLLGTVAGVVIGAALLALIGTNATLLWCLLPLAILVAGVAPAAISFAAGQAAFTLTLVILYNIIQPAGWRVGLVRVEDIALGCAISLVVGLLFWPRGAAAALRQALAEAYTDSAGYLARAVEFGVACCDPTRKSPAAPAGAAAQAAAASRRLDDAFRGFLAERGSKPLPLDQVTSLVTGVAGVRLAADAVMDLWQRDDGTSVGDRAAAQRELLNSAGLVQDWYAGLAGSLINNHAVPLPLAHDRTGDGRLVEAVRHDLRDQDGKATATAVRMIWTGDHLDAVRRLQSSVYDSARAAATARALSPLHQLLPQHARVKEN